MSSAARCAITGSLLLFAIGACTGEGSPGDATTTTTATTTSDGGSGGTGGGGSGGTGGLPEWIPTPADVDFTPLAPVPAGEQILFNDWSFPDRVLSMAPDGSGAVEIFSIYRVWSMGVSRAGDRLAIACGDPDQEAHYGLTLGDAIQHTWLYDFATQSLELATHGNVNDECHHFAPGDDMLYLCRRYDFAPDFSSKGYRIGRLDLSNLAFEWLTDEGNPTTLTLRPQVTPDGADMWFERIDIAGGSQSRSVWSLPLAGGPPTQLHTSQMAPALSPDGQRYLYADTTQGSILYSARLDGSDATLVVDQAVTSATWSPDGSRVAYLLWDDASVCSHVETVAADGSEAQSPTRIRDCSATGESVTDLAWFVRP